MVECCKNIGKALFFIFNGVFWIVGICFLAMGIATLVPGKIHDVMSELGHSTMTTAGTVLVIVGVVSFLVGFAGCCGAIKESRVLLGVYITFLTIILLMEISVGIYVLAEHGKIRVFLYKKFAAITGVKKDGKEAAPLKSIQSLFNCCGFTKGCADWDKKEAYGCTCTKGEKNCEVSKTCTNKANPGAPMYTDACYNKTVDYLENHMTAVGGSVLGIALAEIFGLIIAIVLCRNMKDGSYEAY